VQRGDSKLVWVSASRARGGPDVDNKFKKAHETVFRELDYRWHKCVRVAGGAPRGGRQGGLRRITVRVERRSRGNDGGSTDWSSTDGFPHRLQLMHTLVLDMTDALALSELLRKASNTLLIE